MTSSDDLIRMAGVMNREKEIEQLEAGADINPVQLCADFADLYMDKFRDVPLPEGNPLVIDLSEHIAEFPIVFADYILEKTLTFITIMNKIFSDELHKPCTIHIKNICTKRDRAHYIKIKDLYKPRAKGRLVHVEGVIKSMTFNMSRVITATWRCKICGAEVTNDQGGFQYRKPGQDKLGHSNYYNMPINKIENPLTILELEELPENDDENNSAITVYFDGNAHNFIELNHLTLGSRVKLTGIPADIPEWAQKPEDATKTVRKAVFLCNYAELMEEEIINMTITPDDEAEIRQLAQDPDVVEKLTNSIAPQLEGMTDIKEAVLYSLFGGVRRIGKVESRGIINILLITDPGKGKSSMFNNIKKIAPKCKKVLGGTTTKVGLGAGATKSDAGKFTIEAGALVMANKGILIIDELDKMSPEDMASLHESMESCTVTKTIVGQNRSFNAETAIIAGCNPKSGRFDEVDAITKQINLPPAILSRFDAIFAMRDVPNEKEDRAIITRIYNNYACPETIIPPVSLELLRKYIIYARKINPQIQNNEDIRSALLKFYIGLRDTSQRKDGVVRIPITTRQAESILRFAEASARIRLSEQVEKQDIDRAIRIILNYLKVFAYDMETGTFDVARLDAPVTSSDKRLMKQLLEIMDYLTDGKHESIPEEAIYVKMKESCTTLTQVKFDGLVEKLKRETEVFSPRSGSLCRA